MSKKKSESPKISETVNVTVPQRDLAESLAAFRGVTRGEILRDAVDIGMRHMVAEDNKLLVRQSLISKNGMPSFPVDADDDDDSED